VTVTAVKEHARLSLVKDPFPR